MNEQQKQNIGNKVIFIYTTQIHTSNQVLCTKLHIYFALRYKNKYIDA